MSGNTAPGGLASFLNRTIEKAGLTFHLRRRSHGGTTQSTSERRHALLGQQRAVRQREPASPLL